MRFALTIYLFFALTTSPCLAAAQENTQDQNTPTTEEPNPETVPIPLALRQHLRPNVTKEDFMSQVMQFLRREGFERKKLTASDIERKKPKLSKTREELKYRILCSTTRISTHRSHSRKQETT